MHPSVMEFIRYEVAALNLSERKTLEVGSLNVNGSPRAYFTGEYLGVDMRDGPGVDRVCNAHDLSVESVGSFDVIVCTEMLEHDDAPWISLQEMVDVCRPGGYLLLTCRGFDARGCFPVHEYPHDLWRFSVAGIEALLTWASWEILLVKTDPEAPGVFAVATRPI